MKKLFLAILSTILITGLGYSQEPGSLPIGAQHFISVHFPDETIVDFEEFDQLLNSEESDWLDFDDQEAYEVMLSNGIAIEFGKYGKMTEMESTEAENIPLHALPDMLEAYLKMEYGDLEVVAYEIDHDDQEVELEDGVDLEFDADGRFMEVD